MSSADPLVDAKFRLYFVERIFDYTPILQEYLLTNQEIVCDACQARYGPEQLQALELFGMLCPTCKQGRCAVTNLSRKYEPMLRAIDDELLLPRVELGILHTPSVPKTGRSFRRKLPGSLTVPINSSASAERCLPKEGWLTVRETNKVAGSWRLRKLRSRSTSRASSRTDPRR